MEQEMKKFIAHEEWVKRWAGSYTFISSSYWGKQYEHALKRELGVAFKHSLFIHQKGVVSFYLIQEELDNFGSILAKQATEDNNVALVWCQELKKNTDILGTVMKKMEDNIPSYDEYANFLKYFDNHLPYHNAIKKTIDYFTPETLHTLMPYFQDARLYSEHIYSDTESFFRSIMKKISERENYTADSLTCLTQEEFETYLKEKVLPSKDILQTRYESSLLYFVDGKEYIETGDQVKDIEKIIGNPSIQNKKEVKGVPAYTGDVTGVARVVLDPHNVGTFNQGDILITGMTRPEFLPLMKKASAIVTDAGGILCHAAISARELKVPCVVGTQVATHIFHDGDIIQVDANTGIVSLHQ